MLPRFISVVILIAVGVAYSLQTNELNNPVENAVNFTEKLPADNGGLSPLLERKAIRFYRQKRGLFAILSTVFSTVSRITSLGLTLGAALTEGCMYYPTICDDKREIERLDELIKKNTKLFETEYFQAKKLYLDLKTATLNNRYISYYINQTMQAVEKIQEIEEKLSLMLQIKLPRIDATTKNSTFERHLEQVVGKLEYRLSDLKEMLLKYKHDALIGILVQFAIEATLNKFVNAFQRAYKQVYRAEDILASTNSMFWERVEGVNKPTSKVQNVKHKLKLVPKAFKQMAVNFKQSFVDFKKSVLKWGRIKNWKGFKGKLAHTLKGPLASLQKLRQFFNPKTNAKFVENYKIKFSEHIMNGIGIIGDVITQVVSAKQWGNAANEMSKAKKNYMEYYHKLDRELKALGIEKKQMDEMWNDEIEIFRNISASYKSIVINAAKYSNFSDVIGLSKLPVHMNTPLSKVDFNNINKQSLGSSQTAVLDFLKEVDYNFTIIEDELRAREVLYNNTLMKSEQKEPVHEILSDISSILEFSHSITMKKIGSQLKERDVVCTISILRYDIVEYDFFPLDPFRPRCEVNSSIFDVMSSLATSKRKSKLMQEIVMNSVKTGKVDSLSKLVDSVHSAYLGVNDKNIAAFGNAITEQDIICMISEKFPSRETFDFINLDDFRPNCSSLKSDRFTALLQDASKQRQLAIGIQSDLQTCQELKFCPCLKSLAESKYQSTEADVMRAIKQLRPAWQENREALFCGPPCNFCVHL